MPAKRGTFAFLLALLALTADAQSVSPNDWLERMSIAVTTLDFQGTVIRRRDGEPSAMKVMRRIVDGVVQEKLVSQEGNGLEIVRNGSEVYCILPDKRSVLVEHWDDGLTLFSTLPTSEPEFGSEYDVLLLREERVAGRPAMLLAVRPHDGFRYGHKVWLDRETAFPLRTELVGGDGALLEQLKFADISLNAEIAEDALKPSFDLQSFTWYPEPAQTDVETIDSNWVSDDLPPGFRLVSAAEETLRGAEAPVIHLMYSDGLANVSVFVATPGEDQAPPEDLLSGPSNLHSIEADGYLVTAMGEVPSATVRRIAVSMRRR
ncbi:MAG: MucB/RseB C-terminal domain-containing protein [Pseudomonadota bacterium]